MMRGDRSGSLEEGVAWPLLRQPRADAPVAFRRGRAADMINIAGKRSSLAHLDHHLRAIDGVIDGAFLMPDAERGSVIRLVAFAVAPGRSADAVLADLRQRIDAAFLPRPLLLVQSLPRNDVGKLPRETLLRLAAERGAL